jgi:hypothetical protein
LHEAERGLHHEADVHLEHQENAGAMLVSESDHSDIVQKAESVITKVTADAIDLMKYEVEKKVHYVNTDSKITELYEEDKIAKTRSIKIQMENEGLSREKDLLLKSSDRLALR